jgi:transposase, IS30 family
MAGRGRPGRPPQSDNRERFARLIARGAGNAEACRAVGVYPKTGKRWRLGRAITSSGGRRRQYPPVIGARKLGVSPRLLPGGGRVCIAGLRRAGMGVRAIAGQLGRGPSTVSGELRRNCERASGQCRRFAAQRLAARRRARPGRGKLIAGPVLRQFVASGLEKHWSPGQISRALRAGFPAGPGRHLVHETICQAVYRPELGGLRRDLPPVLRARRRHRKRHRRGGARRAGTLPGMTMISQRPPAAAGRSQAGHWEGDPITGASSRPAIGTLAGRASRFTILVHLPGQRHDAETVRGALAAAMAILPAQLRRSLTGDQGTEMALPDQIAAAPGMAVFFCDPRSPWQRPASENTSGLLRQYFPQGSDLRVHGPGRLAAAAADLNGRPRKTLGWNTPAGLLAQHTAR